MAWCPVSSNLVRNTVRTAIPECSTTKNLVRVRDVAATRLLAWAGSCLLVLAIAAAGAEPVPVPKTSFLDLKQDAREAAASDKTLMLMFEQEDCSYCIALRRVNFADPEIADLLRRRFDIVALDIWGSREVVDFAGRTATEKQYARTFKVQFTPMTVFVAPDGRELFRMTGYYKPPEFLAALRYVAGRHYERESFREYARRAAYADTRRTDPAFFRSSSDLRQALANAAADGKGLALLFEQPDCTACDELRSRAFTDPRFVQTLTATFDVVALDAWGTRTLRAIDGSEIAEKRLAQRLDIHYTPTLVFMDAQGNEVFRADNYRKPEQLTVVLRYLADRGYARFPSFQDWLRATREAPR